MGFSAIFSRVLPVGTLSRDLKFLGLSNFIGAFGDGLFVYTLPIYFRGLSANPADVGLLFSALTLSSALTIIPGGILADRFDRKKIMILGWMIWVPVPLMFSIASHWTQLLPVMSLYGFLIAGPATSAYVATSANKASMTLTFTTISASWSLGYIFSPAIGGYLSSRIGTQWVFILAFFFYGAATAMLFFISSQRPRKLDKEVQSSIDSQSSKYKTIILLSIYFSLAIFFISLVRPSVVQFLQDVFALDNFQVGLLGSVTFTGWAVLSIGLGKIGDKRTKTSAVAMALAISTISFMLLIAFNNLPVLAVASFLSGASMPLWSLMGATIGSVAPEASRGRWISFSQTTTQLAAFLAPYLGGVLYESSPYAPFIIVIVAAPLLSLLAFAKPFNDT